MFVGINFLLNDSDKPQLHCCLEHSYPKCNTLEINSQWCEKGSEFLIDSRGCHTLACEGSGKAEELCQLNFLQDAAFLQENGCIQVKNLAH